MATSSIFHTVVINTPEGGAAFLKALEEAEEAAKHRPKRTTYTREMTVEEMRKFLGIKDDGVQDH